MAEIDIRDKVNIYASSNLSIDDYASLTLLYKPLIGSEALGMYQMMYSLLDRQSMSIDTLIFSNILDLFCMKEEAFKEARLKLEGIGLIETFNKNDIFVILIKQPLSPQRFLVDTLFGAYLRAAVGEDMFNLLVSHFRINKFDRLGYKNITSTFDQVFETVDHDMPNINGFILGRKANSSIEILNHNFDLEEFLSGIDESFLEFGPTPEFKRQIKNISYLYSFNEDDMQMLFNQSIGKNGYFDIAILKKKAYQLNLHSKSTNTLIGPKSEMSVDEYNAMNEVANASMKAIMDSLWPEYPDSYLKTLSELYSGESIIPADVLNILVFDVLKKKEGKLPTMSYFKKALETWERENLHTREDAWKYVRGLKKNSSEVSKPKSRGENIKSNEYSDSFIKNLESEMESL